MTGIRTFLVDADVFISAKNGYYAFALCPGFWHSLIHHGNAGNIRSIDRIRSELLAGRKTEDLVQWVRNDLPKDFFLVTSGENVLSAYEDVMLWVQRNAQYFDQAKAKFATEADGWLVAYAMAHGGIVVTNEQPQPEAKKRIPLPEVCNHFDVTYQDPFLMLRTLAIQFEWMGES